VDGPMARNVPDLALLLDAMAALTQHDPLSHPVPEGGFQAALQRARLPRHIGFSPNFGLRSIDPEVARICRAGAERFTEMGCVVDEEAPDFSDAIDCFQVLRALLFADVRGDLLPRERSQARYTYDFGDNWEHKIVLEKQLAAEPGRVYPVCVAGAGACPPEDCGGAWGYEHLREVLADPISEEHEDMLAWLGLDKATDFDPHQFDIDHVNRMLAAVGGQPARQ